MHAKMVQTIVSDLLPKHNFQKAEKKILWWAQVILGASRKQVPGRAQHLLGIRKMTEEAGGCRESLRMMMEVWYLEGRRDGGVEERALDWGAALRKLWPTHGEPREQRLPFQGHGRNDQAPGPRCAGSLARPHCGIKVAVDQKAPYLDAASWPHSSQHMPKAYAIH